ncbi:hypothetical protein [Flavobacterium sp. C4GT6]|uniref:hypothetical protein n=1 Tax=Flavobacterium sp. C4GT6 TaxID=3103818 RepID=UPI002ED117ED
MTKINLTEKEYELALSMLLKYFDAKPNTIRGKIFQNLSKKVEDYENRHFKIENLDP